MQTRKNKTTKLSGFTLIVLGIVCFLAFFIPRTALAAESDSSHPCWIAEGQNEAEVTEITTIAEIVADVRSQEGTAPRLVMEISNDLESAEFHGDVQLAPSVECVVVTGNEKLLTMGDVLINTHWALEYLTVDADFATMQGALDQDQELFLTEVVMKGEIGFYGLRKITIEGSNFAEATVLVAMNTDQVTEIEFDPASDNPIKVDAVMESPKDCEQRDSYDSFGEYVENIESLRQEVLACEQEQTEPEPEPDVYCGIVDLSAQTFILDEPNGFTEALSRLREVAWSDPQKKLEAIAMLALQQDGEQLLQVGGGVSVPMPDNVNCVIVDGGQHEGSAYMRWMYPNTNWVIQYITLLAHQDGAGINGLGEEIVLFDHVNVSGNVTFRNIKRIDLVKSNFWGADVTIRGTSQEIAAIGVQSNTVSSSVTALVESFERPDCTISKKFLSFGEYGQGVAAVQQQVAACEAAPKPAPVLYLPLALNQTEEQ